MSEQWPTSAGGGRPRAERSANVRRRLAAAAFALSLLTLVAVTAVAVALGVRFEECGGPEEEEAPAPGQRGADRASGERGDRATAAEEDEEGSRPWLRSRLPGSLRPRHYDLNVAVYMDNFTFSGDVSIDLECVNATRFVVLHADRLEVSSVSLTGGRPGSGSIHVQRHFLFPANQMLVLVLHRELTASQTYRLNVTFDAAIEDELLGFFRSSYALYGERRYLAVTQFSPTHARKAFPCFDEPAFKATFSLSLRHDPQYASLANMPPLATEEDEDGWTRRRFARTPRMSTYYLAWAVCNFTYRETRSDGGVAIRLYARPDAIASGAGDYSLRITERLLGFYQDVFRVGYSLPKLDLLAVPKHPYAAMENWGLSVFVEQKILLDARVSSSSYQMELTMVVVHEICHQWFGDLVTPVWWEDVWLKEGFAHYFEYVGTDFLFPKWNMEKQRFLTDVLHEVMLLDGLSSSHPISQEVRDAADIDRVFDWIAYKKGAALIRMLANVMGQTLFRKGLHDYLQSHMYGNAARDDLWRKLSQAMRSEGRDIDIGAVMDGWTLQMGYPVITIGKNQSERLGARYVTVNQEHFLYVQEGRANSSLQWQVPLTVAVGNGSRVCSETLIWIRNKTETHTMSEMSDKTWLLGNINQTGYFRVNYDLQNWKLLIQQLHADPQVISVGNRAGLIDDAFNLARAGYLPQGVALQLLGYLPEETSFLPWHAASRALYQLDKLLDRTDDYKLFGDYVLKQVAARYHQMGWPTDAENGETSVLRASYQTEELRRELIMLACSFGNKHCHRQAVAHISDWISSNKNGIPPNVRDVVYCTGVSLMDEDVWEFIWMKFHSSNAVSEKKILLEALTCSDDAFLLNRLLNLSLTSDLVAEQDAIDVIIHVGRNPRGRNLAWRFFRQKWDVLNARYGEALFMSSKLIGGVTEFLDTEKELDELKHFIQSSGVVTGPALARALEMVKGNVRWHRLHRRHLYQWLRKAPAHG
ncbi:thyrotropin-releasing hormone-degrading ectoenzyme isoform X1 [Corythoichthys intestinalis]|uniref:thyrotropin-releasing hormone-degrading ectoenzyme isoform X1 n=2 Tax=Corythoichthys intestinalis TaxID=161448 RepID=UPI0025A63DA6|nr:thyrotropin-releasing hormone-degrading ectoenzyme isoform X1 [Corythoichthys intestinalis]XP_057710613.1 thyrotropin-releasing hormone-degrading ectoenzyme isoform X1 [Corythoichthys intestinalis]